VIVEDIGLEVLNPSLHLSHGFRGPDHLEARTDHLQIRSPAHLRDEDVDVVTGLGEKTCFILHDAILAGGRTRSVSGVKQ
jgi:hypothetical protein